MSLQNIINGAQQIEMDRRKMAAQTVSRSQRIKTAERATTQPWRFKVTPPAGLSWTDSRGFIEVIDFNDRITEYEISLNASSGMNYITEYQGDCKQAQLNAMTATNYSTSTITIGNLPAIGSTGTNGVITTASVVFAPGDFIQPINSRYPYSVLSTVYRGTGTNVTVNLNRPIITSENINITNYGVKVGNSVTWRVVVMALPTYTLIPIKRVQYNGTFDLIEKII
jgi:hypothetical protein